MGSQQSKKHRRLQQEQINSIEKQVQKTQQDKVKNFNVQNHLQEEFLQRQYKKIKNDKDQSTNYKNINTQDSIFQQQGPNNMLVKEYYQQHDTFQEFEQARLTDKLKKSQATATNNKYMQKSIVGLQQSGQLQSSRYIQSRQTLQSSKVSENNRQAQKRPKSFTYHKTLTKRQTSHYQNSKKGGGTNYTNSSIQQRSQQQKMTLLTKSNYFQSSNLKTPNQTTSNIQGNNKTLSQSFNIQKNTSTLENSQSMMMMDMSQQNSPTYNSNEKYYQQQYQFRPKRISEGSMTNLPQFQSEEIVSGLLVNPNQSQLQERKFLDSTLRKKRYSIDFNSLSNFQISQIQEQIKDNNTIKQQQSRDGKKKKSLASQLTHKSQKSQKSQLSFTNIKNIEESSTLKSHSQKRSFNQLPHENNSSSSSDPSPSNNINNNIIGNYSANNRVQIQSPTTQDYKFRFEDITINNQPYQQDMLQYIKSPSRLPESNYTIVEDSQFVDQEDYQNVDLLQDLRSKQQQEQNDIKTQKNIDILFEDLIEKVKKEQKNKKNIKQQVYTQQQKKNTKKKNIGIHIHKNFKAQQKQKKYSSDMSKQQALNSSSNKSSQQQQKNKRRNSPYQNSSSYKRHSHDLILQQQQQQQPHKKLSSLFNAEQFNSVLQANTSNMNNSPPSSNQQKNTNNSKQQKRMSNQFVPNNGSNLNNSQKLQNNQQQQLQQQQKLGIKKYTQDNSQLSIQDLHMNKRGTIESDLKNMPNYGSLISNTLSNPRVSKEFRMSKLNSQLLAGKSSFLSLDPNSYQQQQSSTSPQHKLSIFSNNSVGKIININDGNQKQSNSNHNMESEDISATSSSEDDVNSKVEHIQQKMENLKLNRKVSNYQTSDLFTDSSVFDIPSLDKISGEEQRSSNNLLKNSLLQQRNSIQKQVLKKQALLKATSLPDIDISQKLYQQQVGNQNSNNQQIVSAQQYQAQGNSSNSIPDQQTNLSNLNDNNLQTNQYNINLMQQQQQLQFQHNAVYYNSNNTNLNLLNNESHDQSFYSTLQNQSQLIVEIKDPNKRKQNFVKQTSNVNRNFDQSGNKMINDYIILKELGRGANGKVKLAQKYYPGGQFQEIQQFYAIKVTKKTRIKQFLVENGRDGYSQLESEIAIMKKLDHRNVVKMVEVIEDQEKKKIYLVMQYAEKGSLMSRTYWAKTLFEENIQLFNQIFTKDYKYKNRDQCPTSLSPEKVLKYFRDLALALDYLHNFCQVVHRDIKPENLLIDSNDSLLIADFGISQIMEERTKEDTNQNQDGTVAFMSPEQFKIGRKFQAKPTDIWAAGCTLYRMVFGKLPFYSDNTYNIRNIIMNEEVSFPENHNFDPNLIDIIKRCLDKNTSTRITSSELLVHPWVTQDGQFILKNTSTGQFLIDNEDIKQSILKKKENKLFSSFLIISRLNKKLQDARYTLQMQKQTNLLQDDEDR